MIKKIIKNRREIVKGAMMVSVIYAAIVINRIRMTYEKNTPPSGKYY